MVHTKLPHEMATSMERIHVQEVYEQIAPHFADLKQKAWPKVKHFLKSLEPGSLVADVGCGNGRYLRINNSIYKIGSDVCQPLVQHANHQGHEVMTADNLHLPYRDGIFDAVISIGVIHHFSSHSRRVQALKELTRVLSPGGKLMVYVWAFEQKHRRFESQDVLVPWHKPCHPSHRTYRGSSSDIDHSSNSSVSDDDTSSLSSFTHCQDSPPDDLAGFSNRIKSLEDFRQPSDDVFEIEDEGRLRSSRSGCSLDQLTLVQECRRLEACLKELSEKQISTSELNLSKDTVPMLPSSKFNYRKKSHAEVKTSDAEATFRPTKNISASLSTCQLDRVPCYLPCTTTGSASETPKHLPLGHIDSSTKHISHISKHNCSHHLTEHASVRLNIFQKLRLSFQGFMSRRDEKSLHQDGSSTCPKNSSDIPEFFAVREFPMSSLRPEQPTQNGQGYSSQNGVKLRMKRNISDMSDCMKLAGKDKQKECFLKSRSPSARSLPLELDTAAAARSSYSRPRVKSLGSQHQESGKTADKSIKKGCERLKLKQNGLQKGQSRSQGDLFQMKMRKNKKSEATLAAASSHSIDYNDLDQPVAAAQGRGSSRPVLEETISDNCLPSPGSTGQTLSNTDLCRFYHVFKEGELVDIVKDNIEDLHIIDTYFDHANWCLIAEKVKLWKI
ncbi:probable tRNA methyltransferase 9B [Haliotis rufescens]|uniref:probable tRNA methyltransferase 9B n=1 Tax=Haliotis rufescens TaxID=6454 RepID=UPI00201F857A|nr:probable tRNA methyltransferase 9B [Haliotis rufescens]